MVPLLLVCFVFCAAAAGTSEVRLVQTVKKKKKKVTSPCSFFLSSSKDRFPWPLIAKLGAALQ
jgi:hypothetical protein